MNAAEIRAKITETIAGSHIAVRDGTVKSLSDKEIDRRVNTLVLGIEMLDSLEKEGKRLKPDQATFNEVGEKTSEGYSKEAYDKKKKHLEKVTNLTNAINKALEDNPDYSKLTEIINRPAKSEGTPSEAQA